MMKINKYINHVGKINLYGYLPNWFCQINEINELDSHFDINNGNIIKKKKLFDLLGVDFPDLTTGKLLITNDYEWKIKCSDPDYVSWNSCFAPDGCNYESAKLYSDSPNVLIAMILNSDETRIIGRRFILLHSDQNDVIRQCAILKRYGTFPDSYLGEVINWLGNEFGLTKKVNYLFSYHQVIPRSFPDYDVWIDYADEILVDPNYDQDLPENYLRLLFGQDCKNTWNDQYIDYNGRVTSGDLENPEIDVIVIPEDVLLDEEITVNTINNLDGYESIKFLLTGYYDGSILHHYNYIEVIDENENVFNVLISAVDSDGFDYNATESIDFDEIKKLFPNHQFNLVNKTHC